MNKTIAYAYAYSLDAVSLGFGKAGCFYVARIEQTKKGFVKHSPEGFATYVKAFAKAETLPEEYHFTSLNVFHARNNFANAPKEVKEFHLNWILAMGE